MLARSLPRARALHCAAAKNVSLYPSCNPRLGRALSIQRCALRSTSSLTSSRRDGRTANEHPLAITTSHSPLSISTQRTPLSLISKPLTRSQMTSAIQPQISNIEDPLPARYEPPKTGLLSKLPSSWVPYAELIRLDKPTGTYYLFWPCAWSTLMAAPLATPIAAPLAVLSTGALFFAGALIMRGAGCTINDFWDRKLDPHVTRTRFRPIARGAVSPTNALVYTGAQGLAGLAVLVQFPWQCFWYAVPSLAFVTVYPLAKRITHYPQFVLGLTFSWGAIMGFPALGVDLLSNTSALTAAACLYASNVAWVILYDFIYAHMDIRDDVKAGIKSIALKHEKDTKAILSGLAVTQVGLLAAAGVAAGAGPVFFAGTCGGAAASLAYMIWRVRLKSPADCWWWFRYGCWLTGGAITAGLGAEYLAQLLGLYEQQERVES
ncbi:4-hydroxybenzoate polyprenyl transferase [Xylona heveae TC161]|uniref:4-hydroxybenzoate polyprenyltransferase, mitochondrial n=1 Tax=Xylona heveae (strain CBS 132557 / TC161) TaxID=1328760 RepID=A0A161TP37_XYLHT|nr:4-hydroxybenzoate polyprenyl transferase [Xylona heveae TC161]KZF23866.1 4-hydroxybenzoate polyprenyl transferase [Xylona heveae TC161]